MSSLPLFVSVVGCSSVFAVCCALLFVVGCCCFLLVVCFLVVGRNVLVADGCVLLVIV